MFVVYFYEDKNLLLNQLLRRIPSVGENLTIKGRKGTVSSVNHIDENKIHVQIIIEKVKVNKNNQVLDQSKKKKR